MPELVHFKVQTLKPPYMPRRSGCKPTEHFALTQWHCEGSGHLHVSVPDLGGWGADSHFCVLYLRLGLFAWDPFVQLLPKKGISFLYILFCCCSLRVSLIEFSKQMSPWPKSLLFLVTFGTFETKYNILSLWGGRFARKMDEKNGY